MPVDREPIQTRPPPTGPPQRPPVDDERVLLRFWSATHAFILDGGA